MYSNYLSEDSYRFLNSIFCCWRRRQIVVSLPPILTRQSWGDDDSSDEEFENLREYLNRTIPRVPNNSPELG
jgi:hypothetical protein